MKDIKFRAWDKENEEMCDIQEWVFGDDGIASAVLIGVEWKNERPASEFILMQYTGLKDKNGKEIYEGDIVTQHELAIDRFDEINHKVWFEQGAYWVGDGEMGSNLFGNKMSNRLEVIGNIYENSDLLKEKK